MRGSEDARRVIEEVDGFAQALAVCAAALDAAIEPEYRGGDLACVLEDIRAWASLAQYYTLKISAALHLAVYQLSENEKEKEIAVCELEEAVEPWRTLAEIWAAHYMPYEMGRVNQTFGYSYYIDDVRRDIEIARRMKTLREQAAEHSVLAEGGFESRPWAIELNTH